MPQGLRIRVRRTKASPRAALVELDGSFDRTTVATFKQAADQIRGRGVNQAVLDMSKITYVNSTGLAALVNFSQTFRQSGGQLVCFDVPPRVARLIDMLGLDDYFPVAAGLKAALEALGLSDSSITASDSGLGSGARSPSSGSHQAANRGARRPPSGEGRRPPSGEGPAPGA